MTNHGLVSRWASQLEEFIASQRALGVRFVARHVSRLRSFDRFVAQQVASTRQLEPAVRGWLSRIEGRKGPTLYPDFCLIRQFCQFLRRKRPRTFVPGEDLAPVVKTSRFKPYIFSATDVRRLLAEIAQLPGPKAPLRRATYRALVLILYCTGLRPGEAVRLRICDVDMRQRTLFVADSKRRSRWVPFRDDLAHELATYLQERTRSRRCRPTDPFFVKPTGGAYFDWNVSHTIRRLLRKLGLKPASPRTGPRLYDFRHTFAVHRLTRWYRHGEDVQGRLPWLSAYMGHVDLLGTETYLSATPELLHLAGSRFASFFRGEMRRQS